MYSVIIRHHVHVFVVGRLYYSDRPSAAVEKRTKLSDNEDIHLHVI